MEKLDEGAPKATVARTPDGSDPPVPEPTVSELKAEISDTQGQLQQTLAEIQERLSPAHLAEQAKNTVREATIGKVTHMAEQVGDTATRMVDQTRRAAAGLPRPVRDNPWPLALIGVGVAWFLVRSRSQSRDDWRHGENDWERGSFRDDDRWQSQYREYSGYEGHAARPTAPAADAASRVQDIANDARERARDLSRRTQYRLGQSLEENPMMLGAVALAAGALIGTLMPRTDVEDSYMGDTRDTLVDTAREMAEDKVQELSQVVREASQTEPQTPGASLSSPS